MISKIEMDKAIAYFMGWRIDNSYPDKNKVWRSPVGDIELDTTFKFSSDWNSLMEVYNKMNETEGLSVFIQPKRCCVYEYGELTWEAPHKEPEISTQEAVYRCLGEFIFEYNKKKISSGV